MMTPGPASDEYETPGWLFEALDHEFKFTLDPCATTATRKCTRFFDKEKDGLAQSWRGERVFVNPPFSNIDGWVRKAIDSEAALCVMLLPVKVDCGWWELVLPFAPRFFRKRVAFLLDGKLMKDPRFTSMVVVIRGR